MKHTHKQNRNEILKIILATSSTVRPCIFNADREKHEWLIPEGLKERR